MTELEELIDELVAKAGPTTGQIKLGQHPDKVKRLFELGWKPAEKKDDTQLPVGYIQQRLDALETTVADHEKRITQCSIRR